MSTRTVGELQAQVDRAIRRVGGYWRALSAVARLLEELAELAEGLDAGAPAGGAASEVADLYVITTCLANQYCADLSREYHRLGLPVRADALRAHFAPRRTPAAEYLRVAAAAGTVARIVNAHEGDKRLKAGERVPSVGRAVAGVHAALFGLAAALGVDVVAEVEAVLARTLARDAHRFATHFDPAAASSLERFAPVRDGVRCPFARRARLWGSPDWDPALPPGRNLREALPHLERFTRVSRHEGLDGFVLEIAEPQRGRSVDALARTLQRVLAWLARHDPTGHNALEERVDGEGWQFSFNGERLFVIAFAPCYGRQSARHAFGVRGVYLLFQPEHSFDAFSITPELRDTIRAGFEAAGQGYDLEIMRAPLEAPRYVKPLRVGDPVVAWWAAGGAGPQTDRRNGRRGGREMADQSRTVEELLAKYSPEVQALTERLRELLRTSAPELTEDAAPRMGNIYYRRNGVVAAITPYKGYTSLHFYKGTRLQDPAGVLEGGGNALRHIKVRRPEDVDPDVIIPLLHQAILLNEK